MKAFATIAFYLLCHLPLFAQSDIRLVNFSPADSVAITVKYHGDLDRLSKELTSKFSNPVLQVRAIFTWITANISYDYRFINKEKEMAWPDCYDQPDCKYIQEKFETELADKTASKKRAIADGYAILFKLLCQKAGIRCEYIKGAVRNRPYQLGNNAPFNHAWNAVFIGGNWYFVDAVLSAGLSVEDNETGKLLPFERKQTDVYFLTPYYQFRKDHCPEKPGWQAILGISSREKFNNQPFYYNPVNYIQNLNQLSPDTGVIHAHVGDTIRFHFSYPITIDRIQVNTNLRQNPKVVVQEKNDRQEINMYALKRQVYLPFEKKGNNYSFKYVVTDRSIYYIDILFKYPADIDATKVLRYKLIIPWE